MRLGASSKTSFKQSIDEHSDRERDDISDDNRDVSDEESILVLLVLDGSNKFKVIFPQKAKRQQFNSDGHDLEESDHGERKERIVLRDDRVQKVQINQSTLN